MSNDICSGAPWGSTSHKYEARYDYGAPTLRQAAAPIVDTISQQIEASKPRTYVHDICVRCGNVVPRTGK